jgi:hypothetical protein
MRQSPDSVRLFQAVFTLSAVLVITAGCAATPRPTPAPAPATEPRAPTPGQAAAPADTGLYAGIVTPALVAADLDTVEASLFDQGKMWTFEFPPMDYLAREYGFRPDQAWFEKARLASLRLPNCSASFVSPHGLVLTNHHCARESVTHVSREGENLHDTGFFAKSLAEERDAGEDFHADQLIALVDVTAQVESRLAAVSEAERAERRGDMLKEVGDSIAAARGGEQAHVVVEVISLWNGGRYSAYVFRRYENVKLVAAPETQIGFFGGDPDNFTYPRYDLDFSFFRIYGDDGQPLDSQPYFQWDADGAQPDEPVFVIGNPGSTSRLQSVAELEFRRDVSDRYLLAFLRDRVRVLEAYADANPEAARRLDLQNTIFNLQNSEKAYEGQLAGLEDVRVLARRLKLQQAFRDSIIGTPELRAEYQGLFEELAQLQARKREVAPGYGAFMVLTGEGFSSATLHRALLAFQVLNARSQGAPAEVLQELREQLLGVDAQPAALDRALMAARFRDFVGYYGQDAAWVQQILQGRTPEAAAAAIQGASALGDSARAAAALEGGTLSMQDQAIQVVTVFLQPLARFQQVVAEASDRETEIAARLGRARLAVYGQAVPPDATFSLRLADGMVKGYEYNGTVAPTHTTFYGLYDRYRSFSPMYREPGTNPWALPERWQTPPAGLDLGTPLNFAFTADIIGGNSGSPVVDRDLRLVGLVFDGNIESLPGDYIFLPQLNRSVAVDVRGIIEALDHVYDLDRLVIELTTGRLPATEAEADRLQR